jgi:hypothetical protein
MVLPRLKGKDDLSIPDPFPPVLTWLIAKNTPNTD